eukprot:9490243-Pyramimonas_sp.AAC.1
MLCKQVASKLRAQPNTRVTAAAGDAGGGADGPCSGTSAGTFAGTKRSTEFALDTDEVDDLWNNMHDQSTGTINLDSN